MSIQIDNNQFNILVKKYLDDRQYIKTLEELNNVDSNRFPAGLISYCEEDKCLYKRNNDDTWTKVNTDEIEPYLFLYEEDEDGLAFPDEEQPIYAKVDKISFEELLSNFINKEEYKKFEEEGIFVSLETNTDANKMYSQSSIDLQIINNDMSGREYLTNRLLDLVKPGFEEVFDVTEMVDSGTFYLLESALNPGEYAMYIIDEEGVARPLGSKQMSLSNYQHLDDNRLETDSKNVVEGINELNTGLKMNNTIMGTLSTLKIDSKPENAVEGLNYCQLLLNKLGDLEDILIDLEPNEDDEDGKLDFIDFINEIDKINGVLTRLTTINKTSFVTALNSFYGSNVPPGSIFPYVKDTPPAGYLMCDGAEYDLAFYPNLYSAIGFNFGMGSTATKFKVPDMADRTIVGYDPDDEDFDTIGKLGGEASVALKSTDLPPHAHYMPSSSHSHRSYCYSSNANVTYSDDGSNRDQSHSGYSTSSTSVSNSTQTWSHTHSFSTPYETHFHTILKSGYDNPTAHENRQPYRRMYFIIKY